MWDDPVIPKTSGVSVVFVVPTKGFTSSWPSNHCRLCLMARNLLHELLHLASMKDATLGTSHHKGIQQRLCPLHQVHHNKRCGRKEQRLVDRSHTKVLDSPVRHVQHITNEKHAVLEATTDARRYVSCAANPTLKSLNQCPHIPLLHT